MGRLEVQVKQTLSSSKWFWAIVLVTATGKEQITKPEIGIRSEVVTVVDLIKRLLCLELFCWKIMEVFGTLG